MYCSVVISVSETSQVGSARRAALQVAKEASLSETDAGRVGLVATELANNLQKYATAGRLVVQALPAFAGIGVEILSIDEGPGVADVDRCLQDGFSTGGTPGSGLGAVKRLSNEFDIYSAQPGGTIVLSRILSSAAVVDHRRPFAWGAISIAAKGETVCGDAWRIAARTDSVSVIVADGLGHGPLAGEASGAAATVFEADAFQGPAQLLTAAHAALTGTRGAAVAVAQLDLTTQGLRYSGVGNIAGTLLTATQGRGLMTHNGIVGAQFRKATELTYPWLDNAMLIMHSDGLHTRTAIEKYPGLFIRHAGVIAAVLIRDCIRGRDDATVVVLRQRAKSA